MSKEMVSVQYIRDYWCTNLAMLFGRDTHFRPMKKTDGYTMIKYKGEPDHARSHKKLSNTACAAFERQVQTNIDVIPTQLKMGFN